MSRNIKFRVDKALRKNTKYSEDLVGIVQKVEEYCFSTSRQLNGTAAMGNRSKYPNYVLLLDLDYARDPNAPEGAMVNCASYVKIISPTIRQNSNIKGILEVEAKLSHTNGQIHSCLYQRTDEGWFPVNSKGERNGANPRLDGFLFDYNNHYEFGKHIDHSSFEGRSLNYVYKAAGGKLPFGIGLKNAVQDVKKIFNREK